MGGCTEKDTRRVDGTGDTASARRFSADRVADVGSGAASFAAERFGDVADAAIASGVDGHDDDCTAAPATTVAPRDGVDGADVVADAAMEDVSSRPSVSATEPLAASTEPRLRAASPSLSLLDSVSASSLMCSASPSASPSASASASTSASASLSDEPTTTASTAPPSTPCTDDPDATIATGTSASTFAASAVTLTAGVGVAATARLAASIDVVIDVVVVIVVDSAAAVGLRLSRNGRSPDRSDSRRPSFSLLPLTRDVGDTTDAGDGAAAAFAPAPAAVGDVAIVGIVAIVVSGIAVDGTVAASSPFFSSSTLPVDGVLALRRDIAPARAAAVSARIGTCFFTSRKSQMRFSELRDLGCSAARDSDGKRAQQISARPDVQRARSLPWRSLPPASTTAKSARRDALHGATEGEGAAAWRGERWRVAAGTTVATTVVATHTSQQCGEVDGELAATLREAVVDVARALLERHSQLVGHRR
jgi:hypothetical protein